MVHRVLAQDQKISRSTGQILARQINLPGILAEWVGFWIKHFHV